MYCNHCKKDIDDDRADCPYCGSELHNPKINNFVPASEDDKTQISDVYKVAMYCFSILGGAIGIFMSCNILFSNKYKSESKKSAKLALIIGVIAFIVAAAIKEFAFAS